MMRMVRRRYGPTFWLTASLSSSATSLRSLAFVSRPSPSIITFTSSSPSSCRSPPRFMTTAYQGEPGDGTLGLSKLSYSLPFVTTLNDGRKVQVGPFQSHEWSTGMELMNLIIREGKSWPFDVEFATMEAFRGYFLSHTAFVVRDMDHDSTSTGSDNENDCSKAILGCFYIKPNYPGRCSHICNGGFITAPHARRLGVAKLMGQVFLQSAKELGYKSAYFNLVFRSNTASVALWESLGFQRVAVLENAANLTGVNGLDTAYGYRFDLETLKDDYLLISRNV